MTEHRGQLYLRAKAIALTALDLPPDDRAARVAALCEGNEALAAEVAWMLGAADVTEPGWSLLPADMALPTDGARFNGALPSEYRIERLLGEGGMGVVYLAARTTDAGTPGEWRQAVALKLLRFIGTEASEAHRRFAAERRVLATLNHPHIAHLLDAGRTADGRPFIAMEYVDGERIDHWCEARQASLRERITLFLKVCDAVQYAHGKLVLHRDIKPANLLVTAEGEPKLLDFGISRLLDATGSAVDAPTVTMHRALTFAYASPEQVRAQPLDVRTDVWSLGVVLYQLVCGKRPFGIAGDTSALAVSQAIVDGPLIAPARLAPGAVPADVDAIVMKALRRDPAARYASVTALADDLRRFLDARPVLARQGRRWYRARLFMRRHRAALGVAAGVAMLLVAFVVTLFVQLQRVQRERDKTQAVASFMADLFEHADPGHAQGENLRVRDMLDRGAAQVRDDPRLSSDTRAALLLSIGTSYNALDQGARAIPLLKQANALQEANGATRTERGRTWMALGRAYGIQTDALHAVEADHRALALLDGAQDLARGDMYTLRTHLYLQQLISGAVAPDQLAAQLEALVSELDRQSPALPVEQEQALTTWALALGNAGRDGDAIRVGQRASALSATTFGKDDPERMHADYILAAVTAPTDPAAASRIYERLIAERERMLGPSGAGMSSLQGTLGSTLARLGEHARAARVLEQAYRSALAEPEPRVDFQHNVLVELAREYVALGRANDAMTLLEPHWESLATQARQGAPWPLANFAQALDIAGGIALQRGRLADARAYYARMPALPDPSRAPDAAAAMNELRARLLAAGDTTATP